MTVSDRATGDRPTLATHSFNTDWLGVRCGISTDDRILRLPRPDLEELVADYRVIEVRCPSDRDEPRLMPVNGLVHVDVQLGYQLSLARLAPAPASLTVRRVHESSPREPPFGFMSFGNERYTRLSLVDAPTLARRYERWAGDLAAREPESCLALCNDGEVMGYAFSRRVSETHLSLDLVAATPQNRFPGLGLYVASLHAYRGMGVRKVTSSFSAHNLSAINVHVALSCRITSSTDIWLYENPEPTSRKA